MTTKTYGDLRMEIPAGWEDTTIITLQGLKPERVADLIVAKQPSPTPPNIMIKRHSLPGKDFDLTQFANHQVAMLEQTLDELQLLQQEDIELDHAGTPLPGVVLDYSFSTPNGDMRQTHIYAYCDQTILMVIATGMMDFNYDAVRNGALDLVESIRIA